VQVKHKGKWQTSEWQPALLEIADRLKAICETQSPDEIGALVSPNATVEEAYLMQKLMRALGSNNIDHRVRTKDFSDQDNLPAYLGLGFPIDEIEKCDAILLVGSYLRHEVPLANYRVLKAVQDDAKVMAINLYDYDFNYELNHKSIVSLNQMTEQYGAVLKAVLQEKKATSKTAWINDLKPDDNATAMAKVLLNAEKPTVFLGHDALGHPNAASLRAITQELMGHIDITPNVLTYGANSAGCALAGATPHRTCAAASLDNVGLTAADMFSEKPRRAYFLLNIEPESDSAFPAKAIKALKDAGLVICFSPFVTDEMRDYADFILPIAPVTETAGTFVNAAGTWQSFKPVSVPTGDARPAWKVLRAIANFLELPSFDYEHADAVRDEVKTAVDAAQFKPVGDYQPVNVKKPEGLYRLGNWPQYTTDSMVRRSSALQETMHEDWLCVSVNNATADQLDFVEGDTVLAKQGDTTITLTVRVHNGLPDNAVCIPMGFHGTKGFGEAMAPIELKRGGA
jgi:NADH-quinone oxidoreductase subunit G